MDTCNILCVDDEVRNLEALERVFRREREFSFTKTTGARQALEIVRQEPIHIIITDQRMPEMTGIELLNKVIGISPDTVRVMLTAYTEIPEMLDAINKGHVYGYITKPWDANSIVTLVRQAKKYYDLLTEKRQLDRELEIKNELLRKKNEDLKKYNELKNRFLVITSHELRTPAAIITGALELLNQQKEGLDEPLQKLLRNALNGAFRLNEIIETFFETIQFKSKEYALHPTVIDPRTIITHLLEQTKQYLMDRKIEVVENVPSGMMVIADQRKLYLVFENLLSNAIKYTPDGGKIQIEAYRKDKEVVYVFRDNGIGIPEEELEKIFDTFYQLENIQYHHTSRHQFMGGGTGLGLSLCKSVVGAHGGKIWAASEGTGKGSSFYISLPLYNNP